MEFFQVECAPCIYTKGWGEDMAIVVIYVDDTLVIAPWLEMVLKVKKQISQRWKMEDSGEVSCHGPGCSRSRRVTGSYGRSAGIEDLVNTSREHGRSAVSMETMDSYGFTCKGALSPYARRTRHSHEEDQARRAGAAMRRTKLRWLPLRGSRDRSRHRS